MRTMWRRLQFMLNIQRFFPFLMEFFRSSRVSIGKKILSIGFVAGYLFFPFDVIPDFLIGIGLVDDVAVLVFVLQQIVKIAPQELKDKYNIKD